MFYKLINTTIILSISKKGPLLSHREIDDETFIENDSTFVEEKRVISTQKKKRKNKKIQVTNIIEDIIKEHNLIDDEKLSLLKKNQTSYISSMLSCGVVDKGRFYSLLAEKLNIEFYKEHSTLESKSAHIVRDLISNRLLNTLNVLIFKDIKQENLLELVISNPFDYETIDFIQSKTEAKIKVSICDIQNIKKALRKLNSSFSEKHKAVISGEHQGGFTKKDLEKFDDSKSELPVIEFVQFIVLEAKKVGASDIHIEPTEEELVVRYRIDGVLQTEVTLPLKVHREVVSRIKIVSDMNVAEKRLPQDGRFDITDAEGSKMDMRVSTFPTVYGEKVVMRLLEQESLKPSLSDLNLDNEDLELLENKINSPYGLILITGPTGSGKTTTLYSALSTIDKDSKNVLTVEDPVEYRLEGVHQMQTNDKIGLTFASGLRTILRQDPDIVMVGEMRDLETAHMAIQASLTGHIVFSTLHTNDAIGVIVRLINMGVEPFLVSSAVSLAVAQRLVRKICPDCVDYKDATQLRADLKENGVTQSKLDSLNIELDDDLDFAYGKGCSSCRGTGYSGRQAVFEFFEPTIEINQEILKPDFDEARIRAIAKRDGMRTLLDNGLELVEEGVTTIDEIIRVIGD